MKEIPQAEQIGAELELAVEGGPESISYRDVGEERLKGATESVKATGRKIGGFMAGAWKKVKSFGSSVAGAGKTALSYTLAAPEMLSDAGEAVGTAIDRGAEYVADKAVTGVTKTAEFINDAATTAAMTAFEEGVAVYDTAKEGVAYVSEKAQGAYEGALKFGREKYAGLRRRVEDARGIFGVAVAEARRRRQERMNGGNSERKAQYLQALKKFQEAHEQLRQFDDIPDGALQG